MRSATLDIHHEIITGTAGVGMNRKAHDAATAIAATTATTAAAAERDTGRLNPAVGLSRHAAIVTGR